MEPRISPNSSPEIGGQYIQPEIPQVNLEAIPAQRISPEMPSVNEVRQDVKSAQPLPAMPILPAPQMQAPPSQSVPANSNPIMAADEEVIEKEWVDRAKKVVAQTKDDPYIQEREVSKLQADYLKKRYGKEIKVTED